MSHTELKELFRVRIVEKSSGKGAVVLCQFPGGSEFVLQFYDILVHTEENVPGTIRMKRPLSAVKKFGRLDENGEIVQQGTGQEVPRHETDPK